MKRADAKLKVALALAALLSFPVMRGVLDGSIPSTSGAMRIGVAIVLSYAGVLLVTSVVASYLPKPEPEPETTPEVECVEDAVVVEDLAPADQPETEDAP